ncbi:TPA: hypothetical protein I0F78_RS03140 [Enterococcus faecalis]|nr:hypothetical protein [Enterococcus faecalis]
MGVRSTLNHHEEIQNRQTSKRWTLGTKKFVKPRFYQYGNQPKWATDITYIHTKNIG